MRHEYPTIHFYMYLILSKLIRIKASVHYYKLPVLPFYYAVIFLNISFTLYAPITEGWTGDMPLPLPSRSGARKIFFFPSLPFFFCFFFFFTFFAFLPPSPSSRSSRTPHYFGWMVCLLSFVWASLSMGVGAGEKSEKSKWKYMYISPVGFDPATSTQHWQLTQRLRPLGWDIEVCFKVLHYHRIWIKSTRDDTCAKLIMIRCVLELTVRQNLHFFY